MVAMAGADAATSQNTTMCTVRWRSTLLPYRFAMLGATTECLGTLGKFGLEIFVK